MTTAVPANNMASGNDDGQQQSGSPVLVTLPERSDEDRKRQEQMKRAWKAYRGEFKPPLKIEAGQPDDNVRTNRCGPIVDKGVSWLMGKEVKVEVRAKQSTEDAAAATLNKPDPTDPNADEQSSDPKADAKVAKQQAWLDAAWGASDDRMTVLSEAAMNGAVCGHAFVKLVPPDKGAGKPYPRLIVLDPQNVFVVTDPDDVNTALAYIIEYDVPSSQPGVMLTKRQVISRVDPDHLAAQYGGEDTDDTWTIANYIRTKQGYSYGVVGTQASQPQTSQWVQIGATIPWPYRFPPIADCMNLPNPNEYWGIADLTPDIVHLNEAINFVESNTNRILYHHASPWAWTNANVATLNVEPGRVIGLPTGTELHLEEMHGDLASSMKFAESLRADMDEQSRVPAVALGRQESLPKGNLSGVALQLLFQPLLEKTEQKRRLYGKLIRNLSLWMLVSAGLANEDDTEIELHWPNLLPVDDQAAAQTALLLEQIGVSEDTLMRQLGYDPDDEARKSAESDAKKLTAFSRGQGMPPMPPADGSMQSPAAQAAQARQAAGGAPPVNHPAAVQARQMAQASAGKKPTPGGL